VSNVGSDSLEGHPLISIGPLSRRVGLSVSSIRKYETEGLVIPFRTPSGRRLFSREDVDRVRNIQHMIQNLGLNLAGIRRIQALLPCWNLLPCERDRRDACEAYRDSTRPCWMTRGVGCTPQGNECRKCAVYRFGSLCTEDIKRVLHDQVTLGDSSAAVKELMQRKLR
jgi:MerR family transcriptional regulator/heat shock protein HspR